MKTICCRVMFVALLAVVMPPLAAQFAPVKQAPPADRYWIVDLAAPASLEFTGEADATLAVDQRSRLENLAPTAPSVTGVARFDVRDPAVKAYAAFLDRERAGVLDEAAALLGRKLEPRHVYRHLSNGFAVKLSEAEAAMLAELPGVRSVFREQVYRPMTDAGPQWIGANRYWAGTTGVPNPNRGEGMVLAILDTGVNWDSPFLAAEMDGMETIQNPRGQFFGLCDQPNVPCQGKLIGVYDFTDEGTDGEDLDNHGSHVASTAVGNPLSFSLVFDDDDQIQVNFSTSGVAPRASLISYKVCEEDEEEDGNTCRGSAIRDGLEQAVEDQVDVVNYSLGSDARSPWQGFGQGETSTFRLMFNLRAAGIVTVAAAGNEGLSGEATVTSPANAPWVVAAANATHDRILGNRLTNVFGGPFALGNLTGAGISGGTSTNRPIVHARDFGNALCGEGPPELGASCSDNTGQSNPFAPGTFSGEIVVCDRGEYGRVEKGRNLELAGAGGYILANTDEFGESVNSDVHCLPATHVGEADGDRLRDWLASGSGHSGRLTGTNRFVDSSFGGRLAASSGRGPSVGAPDLMKPNLTAPGSSILAAGAGDENAIAFLSGTSMAAPHVAGAVLLLQKSHPDWGPAEIISALETTSVPSRVSVDGDPARIIDRGAGGVQVDRAARIGLFLPVSQQQFLNANPADGGDPGALNLPGIVSDECLDECSFTRTVQALGNSTWSVSTEGPLELEVSPSSFSLQPGEQQQITVTVRRGATDPGDWGWGSVLLSSSNTQFVTQRLPVGALISFGELPDGIDILAASNRGQSSLELEQMSRLPEAVFRTSALVKPERREVVLSQDPSPNNPFSGGPGTFFTLVDVPQDALILYAETFESTAEDIDLFVGRDDNGNGQPDESELVCMGITFDDLELCIVEQPEPGSWWILVQNWEASSPTAQDDVPFEWAVLAEDDDPSFVASGPGLHESGPLSLPLFWDQPAMRMGERWLAALGIATEPDFVANVGVIPVTVTRNQPNQPQDTALFDGEPMPVVFPPDARHDRLFIDVPPSATALTVEFDGDPVSASIRRRGFDELEGFEPSTPPAPDSVITSGNDTGTGLTLNVSGANLSAGRHYVVIESAASSEPSTVVTATIDESARIHLRLGLWSSLNRSTNQGLEWQPAPNNSAFSTWYTYEVDSTPTFYQTPGAQLGASSSTWSAPLFRFTSNRIRQTPDQVGKIQVTALAEDRFLFSWRINGRHGSELFKPDHGTGCVNLDGQELDLLGHWRPTGVREGGATALFVPNAQAWIRYYYDQFGIPRWVQANSIDSNPQKTMLEVFDFRGFCPYCEETGVSFEEVGVFERQMFSETEAHEILDFVARPPLNTVINTERDISRLSSVQSCP